MVGYSPTLYLMGTTYESKRNDTGANSSPVRLLACLAEPKAQTKQESCSLGDALPSKSAERTPVESLCTRSPLACVVSRSADIQRCNSDVSSRDGKYGHPSAASSMLAAASSRRIGHIVTAR